MKYVSLLLLTMLMLLAGCATREPGARGNIPVGDQRCVASSLDAKSCAQYANLRCSMGFEVFEKEAKEDDGVVRRAFYFKCLP